MSEGSERPLRLGVSACLMGERVRYDGGDKHQPWITGTLARHVDLVPICPEVATGLGVPREPMHLAGDPARPRAIVIADGRDVTVRITAWGRRTVRELADLSGFILKARSPSCGLEVKVHGARARSSGLFVRELKAALPLLPLIDEESLGDEIQRDNFLERAFAWRRWRAFVDGGVTRARLTQFHAAHKLILLAHSPVRYRALGQLVAGAERFGPRVLSARYAQEFMATLALEATPRKHANVLHHLMGYLKRQLTARDKTELLESIEELRAGRAPRLLPLALLRHHFAHHPHPWVAEQIYLYPETQELHLRCG